MKNKPIYKKWWFWLLIIIGIGATNDFLDNGKFDSSPSETTTTTVSSNTTTSSVTTTTTVTTEETSTTVTTERTVAFEPGNASDKFWFKKAVESILENGLRLSNFKIESTTTMRENRVHVLSDGTELKNVLRGSFRFTWRDRVYSGSLMTNVDEEKQLFTHIKFTSDYSDDKIDQSFTIKR